MANPKDPDRPCPKCGRTPEQTYFHRKDGSRSGMCADCCNSRRRDQYKKRPRSFRYGIQPYDEEKILKSQNGLCPICLDPIQEKKTHLDHNHMTGEVRGILCAGCNIRLPIIEDRSKLKRALAYLKIQLEELL